MKLVAPILTLIVCYAFFLHYVFATYSELPARLATHFGINGQPNGWMGRDGFFYFSIGFGTLLPAFVVGAMGITCLTMPSRMNLPNRDYWLTPERRGEVKTILFQFGLWFACMSVLFVTGVHWLIIQSNLPGQGPQLPGMNSALVVGGFLTGTLLWSGLLILRFCRKG